MSSFALAAASVSLLAVARAQVAGPYTPEVHPSLQWTSCTTAGGCATVNGSVVLDADYRWQHQTGAGNYNNCQVNGVWNATFCPDPTTCAQNCAVEGVDYATSYGVTTPAADALEIDFSKGGARLYLLQNSSYYEPFHLLNKEFSFDVELSTLGCGLNGALYFSEMPFDGGASPTNLAGPTYGTGYCDAQCPGPKFINGGANIGNSSGTLGVCCNEMDIWEANSEASAMTPHPCNDPIKECVGSGCTGECDSGGCDWNAYRLGQTTFYGPGLTVDTTKKFTVLTQFFTDDSTATGNLVQMTRIYIQNGKVINLANTNIPGMPVYNTTTDAFCAAEFSAFDGTNTFAQHGGMKQMGGAFQRGMVLVLSLWDDASQHMLWLDALQYPTSSPATAPGVARGPCAVTSGDPTVAGGVNTNATVTFSNIRFGDLYSTSPLVTKPKPPVTTTTTTTTTTTKSTTTSKSTTTTTKTTTTTMAPAPTQTKWGQCGGTYYSGPTKCASGSTCKAVSAPYYYQCL